MTLVTVAQWNVRTLLDREAADGPERRNLPTTNSSSPPYVKQVCQSMVASMTLNTLSSGVANQKEKEGRPEWAMLSKRI